MSRIVIFAVVLTCVSACLAEPLSVKLTVPERAGFDRVDEPVTFGLPLPAGAVRDVQTLCLLDEAGKVIPASFAAVQLWQPAPGREQSAGSVRWVHVSCLLSVKAKQTRTITLTSSPSPAGGGSGRGDLRDSPLKVSADAKAGKASIDTGVIRLALNANLPGVIESAQLGDKQVISGSAGSSVTAGGKTLGEIDPATAKVEILEAGPMRAVVLLTGAFKDSNTVGTTMAMPRAEPDADAVKGQHAGPGLIYEARVYAYANSPRVFVDYTIINKIGSVAANKIDLEDLSVSWATAFAMDAVEKSPFGMEDGVLRPEIPENVLLPDDGLWRLRVTSLGPDYYRSSYPSGATVMGLEKKNRPSRPTYLGAIDVKGQGCSLLVGIRDFWQTYPKQLDVTEQPGGATVRIALYPKESRKAQELFIGQARTHRIVLFLHDGKASPDALNAIMAATNIPLLPVAEPAWYCQKTQAWGPITSADADYGRFADVEKHYNKVLSESMDNIVRNVEVGLTMTRGEAKITQDGYGWMNWGDSVFRWAGGVQFAEPHKNLSWNGNYYDYGMTMVYQWARTGEWRYLDHGLRAGAYTADVFNNHWQPDATRIGACHYCPPRYHAATDNGVPFLSVEFNHAKVASIMMRWQMLGDHWARHVMLQTFNHADVLGGADGAGWRQCRGNGHRLHMLWCAYEVTGERRYVARAERLLKLGVDFIKRNTEFDKAASQRFMVGIALEGMIQSQWLNPSKDVAETIKFVADYAADEQNIRGYTANMAMAYGWLWQQTGEEKYLNTLARLIRASGSTGHAKNFGQTFRSTPYAIGSLQRAGGGKE